MSTTEKNDLAIIEEYYRNEAPDMISFASYILGDKPMAEVSVQETFLIALKKIEKLKASPNPVGWLYVTLKNVIRHIRRDQQKQLAKLVSMDDIGEIPYMDKDLGLWMLLESLNDADAKLLFEFYVEKRSLKELSAQYGITVGACKMRIKRAKMRAQE